MCGIDYTVAQMITTAIAVSTDGNMIVSNGATFGIFLAIVFSHGFVGSAGTRVLARLNLFYVFLNCDFVSFRLRFPCGVNFIIFC